MNTGFLRASCAVLFAGLMLAPCPGAAAPDHLDFDQGIDAGRALGELRAAGGEGVPAVGAQTPVRPKEAEWAILYFINGKNDLSGYVDPDLNHMEEIGSSDKLKIVAQVGKAGEGVKRYLMTKDSSTGTVTSSVVQDMGNADMGDWKTLAEFGKWAKANYPAKRYLLSIWNHGSGWVKDRPQPSRLADKGISYDYETGHHMTTTELAQALAAMGGVDIYASDACLMQMAEVGYELRELAGVVLGSEENEPGQGWNYALYLGPLAAEPGMSPERLSRVYVEAFRASYAAAGLDTTHSAVAAAAYRGLVPVVNAWTAAVMSAGEGEAVRSARSAVQTFSNSDNVDLPHFVRLLNARTQAPAVSSAGDRLLAYVREKLLLDNAVTGDRHPNASGLAVYLPAGPVSGDYAELAWARESGWPAFAAWIAGLYAERPTVASTRVR